MRCQSLASWRSNCVAPNASSEPEELRLVYVQLVGKLGGFFEDDHSGVVGVGRREGQFGGDGGLAGSGLAAQQNKSGIAERVSRLLVGLGPHEFVQIGSHHVEHRLGLLVGLAAQNHG